MEQCDTKKEVKKIKDYQWKSPISGLQYKVVVEKHIDDFYGELRKPDNSLYASIEHPILAIVTAGIERMILEIQIREIQHEFEELKKEIKKVK